MARPRSHLDRSPRLRLVHPPRDFSGIGEAIVRLAELAATVHAAQTVRGCTPAHHTPLLRLVGGIDAIDAAPSGSRGTWEGSR